MSDVDMEFTPREVGIEDAGGPDMVFTEREVARHEQERAAQQDVDMVFTPREVGIEDAGGPDMEFTPREVDAQAATDLYGGMYDDDVDMVFTEHEAGIANPQGPDMVFTEREVARLDAQAAEVEGDAPAQQMPDVEDAPDATDAPPGQLSTDPDSIPFNDEERRTLRQDLARFREANPDATEADVSAWRIRQCWRLAEARGTQPQPETELSGLDTPEGRRDALEIITQQSSNQQDRGDPNDPDYVDDDPTQDHRCGPAALVGAALYADGPEGLRTMIATMREQGMSRDDNFLMTELETRLAAGEAVTVGDIQSMQTSLYNTMRTQMSQRQGFDPNSQGIDDNTMQAFINNSPALAAQFREHGMQIQHIDSEGGVDPNSGFTADGGERPYERASNRGPDHFVLRMTGPDGEPMIYDPQLRAGGQIIDFEEGVQHYDNTTQRTLRAPAAD